MEDTALSLSNVVRFEIPAYAGIDDLCAYIRPRWGGSIKFQDDVWYVSARIRRSKNDLAELLREVEAYVAEAGLQAIRYELDGRFYIMEARVPEPLAAAA
jgi:predicted PP-loop superfamily ATPase